jgi:hypothetical protein
MTAQQVFESFQGLYEDGTIHDLKKAHDKDEVAVREEFANYTDSLTRDNQMTEELYNVIEIDDWFDYHERGISGGSDYEFEDTLEPEEEDE